MDTTTNRENFHIPQQSTKPAEHLLATGLDEISRMYQEAYDVATPRGAIDPTNPEEIDQGRIEQDTRRGSRVIDLATERSRRRSEKVDVPESETVVVPETTPADMLQIGDLLQWMEAQELEIPREVA